MTRVLVVEDEESYSDALAYMLRKEGYDVAIATTGPDALTEFDRNGADIVLLDLMLPGMPGTEVCRQIRVTSSVPVIMVSAKDDEVDKVVGLELGADDYVTKPFSPKELLARVRAVLRRASDAASPSDLIRVGGDVELDVPRMEARFGGRRVDLTKSEFQLVAAMARQPGRVFTRSQLLDVLRGVAFESYERAIDAHVKNIRRKVGARYIETVFGVGYRFAEPPDR